MFENLKVKEIRKLLSDFKKEHNIVGSIAKLKKAQLVEKLNTHFILQNGKLVLKPKNNAPAPVVYQPQPMPQIVNNNGLTAGQQRLQNTVSNIEREAVAKERYVKDNQMSKRIRGNRM